MRVRIAAAATALALLTLAACESKSSDPPAEPVGPAMCENIQRPRSNPIEFVGVSITRPIDADGFVALMDPLFGEASRTGTRHQDYELSPGVLLSVAEDPRTTEQAIVTLDMTPVGETHGVDRRTILRVPVSYAYGGVYIDTVRAALAQADELYRSEGAEGTSPFFLEYRVRSVQGGFLTIRLSYDGGNSTLTFETENPRTSLTSGRVNQAAFTGDPYETVGGTVWFTLTRDQFDFFTNRAYGASAGALQNFVDFQLVPHNWLRLTVTPRLEDRIVDVAFEVLTVDGRRLQLAAAPASLMAGEQFQQNVFRMVDNMRAQERREPGSSSAWTVPFYYDDPEGGGVVSVIAQGDRGQFKIAYAVESPTHPLRDVDFVPYLAQIEIPEEIPMPPSACSDVGSEPAAQGRFQITFDASSTVRNNPDLKAPLRGNVWGDIYSASDVTITGPREGARPVASFSFEDVDLTDPSNLRAYDIDTPLIGGGYQILGFIDIDGDSATTGGGPDPGDPVTLPIGNYVIECAMQPVTVEFAIVLPEGAL